MEKVELYEFENEQAFEDYLITSAFIGWDYFQSNLTDENDKTFGLFVNNKLVSAIKFKINNADELHIHAMQTKNDLQCKGYGTQLLNLILKKYHKITGIFVKWTTSSLKFWVKQGFQFCMDLNLMMR